MTQRFYKYSDKKLNVKFIQNENDFIVDEQNIKFTGSGNFVILKVKKVNLETWELIDKFAKFLNIYSNEIGYAGLKDKRATTTQYISIPKKYSKQIKSFKNKKVSILESTLHKTKLNIGDLEGNRFKINLYDVEIEDLNHIQSMLKKIAKFGLPNYFGYQRFGKEVEENLSKAKDIIGGELIIKDKKLSKMFIAAYQSDFFNRWLVNRLKHSQEFFDLKDGDVFNDMKKDKLFTPKKINDTIIKDCKNKNISVTGLLPGRKVYRALGEARKIEEKFDDMYIQDKGYRRDAIIFPKNVECNYSSKDKRCTLQFTLPKGSYATVLIEALINNNLK